MYPKHVLFVICVFPLAYYTHKSSMASKTTGDQIGALKIVRMGNMQMSVNFTQKLSTMLWNESSERQDFQQDNP